MAKGRAKKLRVKKNGMEVEGTAGGSGGGGGSEWQTGPVSEKGDDFIGMDTTDVGADAEEQLKQQKGVRLLAPVAKRGQTSKKQKERKRKSMEKAFAVSSRKETKFKAQAGTAEKKKLGKKLWANDARQ